MAVGVSGECFHFYRILPRNFCEDPDQMARSMAWLCVVCTCFQRGLKRVCTWQTKYIRTLIRISNSRR